MSKEVSFEEALEKLKGSVEKLDEGDLTLKEMVDTYEEGTKMAKLCQKALDDAKGKILLLNEQDNDIEETQFE